MADEIKEFDIKTLDIKTLEDYNWTLLNFNSIRYLLFHLLPSFQEVSIVSTSGADYHLR